MTSIEDKIKAVKIASQQCGSISLAQRNQVLEALSQTLIQNRDDILKANAIDLKLMSKTDPRYDRLELTNSRIEAMANELLTVRDLPSPIGQVLLERKRPNGLLLKKISVPLGVIGIIYESRPNVTIDVFALCFKAGNACVLKGGKEAFSTNQALVNLINQTLSLNNLPTDLIYLMPPERSAVSILLNAVGLIDVCIPRGSAELIKAVRQNAKIPVIETGAGIVHTYFDMAGDLNKGKAIVNNAKTRRVSVCNALDTLIVHEGRLTDLDELVAPLIDNHVEIFADEQSYAALSKYPKNLLHRASLDDFGKEFLSLKMSIKTVPSYQDAVSHIMQYTSGHSEAIISEDQTATDYFLGNVDAAAVYVNASTAFTDGGEFGMGSEIGISTQKLHARGPMGLEALTSYKWLVYGNGQIR